MKKILRKVVVVALATFALSAFADSSSASQFTPSQVEGIQKIVHDYLVKNPNVLVEASQALQQQMQAKQQKQAETAIKANAKEIFNNASNPVGGNPNGTVTLVEFFDYQCGHCKAMNKVIQNIVKKDSNVRVVYKELPIFGGNSQYAAKVALALQLIMPSKYYAFHDALLSESNPLTKVKVFEVAHKIGLTDDQVEQLKKKMDSSEVADQIKANFKLAQELKLVGTPAFVIGNKDQTDFRFVPGATSEQNLQKLIKALS